MRPMKQETYDAIKSGQMIGFDKFNYTIDVEGVASGSVGDYDYDFVSNAVLDPEESGDHEKYLELDFVVRNDGRVLVVYCYNNYPTDILSPIYYQILDSEDFITNGSWGPDSEDYLSVSLGTQIYVHPDKYGNFNERPFSLIKLNSGKILLFINSLGNKTAGRPKDLKVFISNNGQGTDFVPFSIVVSKNRTTTVDTYLQTHIGKPVQLPDGSILVWGAIEFGTSDMLPYSDVSKLSVFKSTDGGLTWTRKTIQELPYMDDTSLSKYRYGNLVSIGDTIFGVCTPAQRPRLLISNDNGETWTYYGSETAFDALFPNGTKWDTRWGSQIIRYGFDYLNLGGTIYHYRSNARWVNGWPAGQVIFKYIGVVPPTMASLSDRNNYEEIVSLPYAGISTYSIPGQYVFSATPKGTIIFTMTPAYVNLTDYYNISGSTVFLGVFFKRMTSISDIESITISKGKGGANTANISLNNKDGIWNPKNIDSELFGILNLNKRVQIMQGYGNDLATSFTGIIDSIKMSTFPQKADIALRDYLKVALDQTVTKSGSNTITYSKQPIEDIVTDLANLAGLQIGFIEPTGISIEKEFSWQSYADAFQFLADIASFEYLTDEDGRFHFRRDSQPDNMRVSWSFEEGVDISNLSYEINDSDLYRGVRVYGRSGETVIQYQAAFLDADEFNILPQKLLKVDATEASTINELRKIAERALATMRSRTRVIEFSTPAIPHLQIGDFIQLFESSTRSADIYRLSSMTLTMNKSQFMMNCKAYYYGDSIVPIELPEDIADQPIPNPSQNLIPEMTSNTTPSGVCRSSSVYVLYSNDYKPWNAFNSTSDDLFWDASVNHGWIEYQFTENVIVDKYMLKARQNTTYNLAMPRDWTFEAFDGEKWIVLDTRSGQTSWAVHEQRSFLFTNTVAYSKYRLNVSRNCGYKRLQLEQLAMYYGGGA